MTLRERAGLFISDKICVSRSAWQSLIKDTIDHCAKEQQISDALAVSRETISRWVSTSRKTVPRGIISISGEIMLSLANLRGQTLREVIDALGGIRYDRLTAIRRRELLAQIVSGHAPHGDALLVAIAQQPREVIEALLDAAMDIHTSHLTDRLEARERFRHVIKKGLNDAI